MSTQDDKGRVERAFIGILASEVTGVQFIAGSDRDTVAQPTRVSVSASGEPIPGCNGFIAEVEVLVITPDDVSPSARAALVKKVECALRKYERLRAYLEDADVTVSGFAMSATSEASAGQMNGDLVKLTAGIERGEV